jgi:hypothetical protein
VTATHPRLQEPALKGNSRGVGLCTLVHAHSHARVDWLQGKLRFGQQVHGHGLRYGLRAQQSSQYTTLCNTDRSRGEGREADMTPRRTERRRGGEFPGNLMWRSPLEPPPPPGFGHGIKPMLECNRDATSMGAGQGSLLPTFCKTVAKAWLALVNTSSSWADCAVALGTAHTTATKASASPSL